MKENDKLCILMFDEMSLKTNVTYNERKDSVTGFVTNREETKKKCKSCTSFYDTRATKKL